MRDMVALLSAALLLTAHQLAFTTPPGWRPHPPGSSMRVAEFSLPRVDGDAEDGQLVVYYFGGQGGSVEANLERWVGQMQQPGGGSSAAVAKKETRTVNGLAITLLDVTGTYVAEMSPGAATRNNKPDYRLRAAVVQTPNGPYFIKLVGPARTIARWDAAYSQFIGSLTFQ